MERETPVQILSTTGPEGGLAALWFSSGAAAHARAPQCVALGVEFTDAVARLRSDESFQGVVLDAASTTGWAYFPRSEVLGIARQP